MKRTNLVTYVMHACVTCNNTNHTISKVYLHVIQAPLKKVITNPKRDEINLNQD